jgi:epoxyqueuosine reductase QueG
MTIVADVMNTLERIQNAAAAPYGLNLVAATPIERYDATITKGMRARELAPGARSIVIIGNGGGDFWAAFKRHAAANPGWMNREHPLDDFTREIVESSIAAPLRESGHRCTVVYPFVQDARTLNFMELGKLAGLAGPSIVGVGVHPEFGPWIAFRAALLLDELIDAPGPAIGFDPCPSCVPRSCIAACPVGAVSVATGWDLRKCLTHRVEVEADCESRCHSRVACVLGPQHVYPDDELAYHHRRALRAMKPWYDANIRK